MKIPKSLRDQHANYNSQYAPLEERVENILMLKKKHHWHYEGRLKTLESFALKVESGKKNYLDSFEDFFACTLVVENLASIKSAEEIIRNQFEFFEKRPPKDNFTTKNSDSFHFDDLRLYVKWKDTPLTKPTGLDGLLFEVQIKTFFAHSWALATHDLIYKTDEVSWPKERIAFQIKAMLEHAEVSIYEAEKLSKSNYLKKTDIKTKEINSIIKLINSLWTTDKLPKNKKLLAENIYNLIVNIGISLKSLSKILEVETNLGRGKKTLNLSPYSTIVQSLFNQKEREMQKFLTGPVNNIFKIYLPREITIPSSMPSNKFNNCYLDTTI